MYKGKFIALKNLYQPIFDSRTKGTTFSTFCKTENIDIFEQKQYKYYLFVYKITNNNPKPPTFYKNTITIYW